MNFTNELMRGVWLMDPLYADHFFAMAINDMLKGNLQKAPDPGGASAKGLFGLAYQTSKGISMVDPMAATNTADMYELFWNPDLINEKTLFVLDVAGPITKYNSWYSYGTKLYGMLLQLADAHPNIQAHVLKIDSGGGEGYACSYLDGVIASLKKPVYTFVEGYAASAAYWIASHGKMIGVSNNMDRVGSIGTYVTIADYTGFYEQMGIKLREIYARKSKDKNKDYHDALEGKTKLIQEIVDQYNEVFLARVASSRKGSLQGGEEIWGTGKMFFTPEALNVGLVDIHISIDEFLEIVFDETK